MVKLVNQPLLVSVLLPVYNSARYVSEALTSITNQSYKNLEIIIIDDGSSDETRKIINRFNDNRIKFVPHSKNKGLVPTLNEGVAIAKGKYIVRMDADDISLPDRIDRQVKYMEMNKNVGICGGWIKVFGKDNYIWKTKENHESICARMLFETSIAHPSMIIRKSILKNLPTVFSDKFPGAEDFYFAIEISKHTTLHNLQEIVLEYRVHDKQVSSVRNIQQKSTDKIRNIQLNNLGIKPSKREFDIHMGLGSWKKTGSFSEIRNWLNYLISENNKSRRVNSIELQKIAAEKWLGTIALYEKNKIKKNNPVIIAWFTLCNCYL